MKVRSDTLQMICHETCVRPLRRGLLCASRFPYNTSMIRPALPADSDTLVALTDATGLFKPIEIAALREVLDDFHDHRSANHHAILLEDNDAIVGFAYYGHDPMTDRTWQVWWLAIRKDQQGKGAGTRLLRHIENDIFINHRGRLLFIETSSPPHYELTRQFYRKLGYEEHAILKDFYAAGDSMVVFRKANSEPDV